MSVNIFGSSGTAKWKSDNKYVDRKFITLTNNLVTKVNKTGDTLTGPLSMGEHKISSSHIPVDEHDLVNKKYIDALTSGEMSALVLASKIDSKLDKSGGILTGPLDIGPNKIMSSYVAIHPNDIPNKEYVDSGLAHRLGDDDMRIIVNNLSLKLDKSDIATMFVKNNVGYIPDLDKNIGKSGFIVTASSEAPPVGRKTFDSHNAFNCWKGEWRSISKNNAWIKIKCPEMIRIHKIALRGLDSYVPMNIVLRGLESGTTTTITWKLESSNDDINWIVLYEALPVRITPGTINLERSDGLTNVVKYSNISNKNPFNFFKITINETWDLDSGLSYFQLFTLDEVVTL